MSASEAQDAEANGASDSPKHSWYESASATDQPGPGEIDTGMIGNLTASLGGIIVLILLCGWALKKLGWADGKTTSRLNVVASRQLGKHERLVIVERDGQSMTLGVTSHGITRLDRESDTVTAPPHAPERRHEQSRGFPGVLARHRYSGE